MRDALAGAEGISSLVLTGDGLHVVVDDAARRVPEFKARLDAAHVSYDAMQQVAPTHRGSVCRCGERGGATPWLRTATRW